MTKHLSFQAVTMKTLTTLSCLLAIIALSSCSMNMERKEWAGDINWRSLEQARVEAKEVGKPLMIDFYVSEACHRCMMMAMQVYAKPEISQYINVNFIPAKINISRTLTPEEHALGKKYDFNYDCLVVFETADGEVIEDVKLGRFCFVDPVDPKFFMGYLERANELATAD